MPSNSTKGKGSEHPARMMIQGIGEDVDPQTGEQVRWFDTCITADVVDRQGEVLDPFGFTLREYRDILKAPIIDTHSNITVGRFLPESLRYGEVPDPDTGKMVAAILGRGIVHVAPAGYEQYPVWDECWEHVKRHYEMGKPSGVSIGGDPDPKVGKQVRCQNGKCHIFVPKIYWYETSIVRTPQGPANPLATISAINAAAKRQSPILKDVSALTPDHVSSLAKAGGSPAFAFSVPFLSARRAADIAKNIPAPSEEDYKRAEAADKRRRDNAAINRLYNGGSTWNLDQRGDPIIKPGTGKKWLDRLEKAKPYEMTDRQGITEMRREFGDQPPSTPEELAEMGEGWNDVFRPGPPRGPKGEWYAGEPAAASARVRRKLGHEITEPSDVGYIRNVRSGNLGGAIPTAETRNILPPHGAEQAVQGALNQLSGSKTPIPVNPLSDQQVRENAKWREDYGTPEARQQTMVDNGSIGNRHQQQEQGARAAADLLSKKWLNRLKKAGPDNADARSPGLPMEDSTPEERREKPLGGGRVPPPQGELFVHGNNGQPWNQDSTGGLAQGDRADPVDRTMKAGVEKMPRAPRYRASARASMQAATRGDEEAAEQHAKESAAGFHGRVSMLGRVDAPKPAIDQATEDRVRRHYASLPKPVIRKAAKQKCEDCGKPSVGFLSDAFLCADCMQKSMGPIKLPAKFRKDGAGAGGNAGSFAPSSGLGVTTSTPGTTQFRVGGKMYDRSMPKKKRKVTKAMVASIILKQLGHPATPVEGLERFGSSEEDGIKAWAMPPVPADEPAHFQDAVLEWMQAAGGPGAAQAQIQQALVMEQQAMMEQGRASPTQPPSPFTLYLFRLMAAIQPPPPPMPMAQQDTSQPSDAGEQPDESESQGASPSDEGGSPPNDSAQKSIYASRGAALRKAAILSSFRKVEPAKPAKPKDDSWLPSNLQAKLNQQTPQAEASQQAAGQNAANVSPKPAQNAPVQAKPAAPAAPAAKPAPKAPAAQPSQPSAPAAPKPSPPKKEEPKEEDPLPHLAREQLRESGMRHTPSKDRKHPEETVADIAAEEDLRHLTGDESPKARHAGESPSPYLTRLRELQERQEEQNAREAEQAEESTIGKPFRQMQRDLERGVARSDKEQREAKEREERQAAAAAAQEQADKEMQEKEAAWQREAEAEAQARQAKEDAFFEDPYEATGIPDPYQEDLNAQAQQFASWQSIPGNAGRNMADFQGDVEITGGDPQRLARLAQVTEGARLLFDPWSDNRIDPQTGQSGKRTMADRLQSLANSFATSAMGKTIFGEDVEDRILSDYLSSLGMKVGDIYGRAPTPYDPRHPITGEALYNEKVLRFIDDLKRSGHGDREIRRELSKLGITMPDYMGHHSDVPMGPMGEVAAGREPQDLHIKRLMRDFGLSETYMRGKYREQWTEGSPEEQFRLVQYEAKVAEEMANRREAFIEEQQRQEQEVAAAQAKQPKGQTQLPSADGNTHEREGSSAARPGR